MNFGRVWGVGGSMKKEITCRCGFRFDVPKKGAFIACPICNIGHTISEEPFVAAVAISVEGTIVTSRNVKKNEIVEKCPLMLGDLLKEGANYFFNQKGEKAIPLGLVLRYESSEDYNTKVVIKDDYLWVLALRDIPKHKPLTLRGKHAKSSKNN